METNLTKTSNQIAFTEDQVSLIKKQIAPRATDDELKLFLYQAKRTGLDPLTRQIYCIHRAGKMNIQTSIDGFRVIAERSGDYGGQDEPEFVENEKGELTCCKIRVYKFRGDQRYQASVGVAYWSEYFPQDNNFMWKKMPHTMLAKVAEALALRKAYPQDLSGLYTGDEMEQAGHSENGQTNGSAYTPAEPIPTQVTTDERTVDELHKDFMKLLEEYKLLVGDEALRYHPDQWKRGRGPKNYRAAIEDMKIKISEAQTQVA